MGNIIIMSKPSLLYTIFELQYSDLIKKKTDPMQKSKYFKKQFEK